MNPRRFVGYNSVMQGKPIGEVLFIDGQTRPVFVDSLGVQYVLDDKGRPVVGVWLLLPDSAEQREP